MKLLEKAGAIMVTLGALATASTIMSIVFAAFLMWFRNFDFLPSLLASIATNFLVVLQTFILNRYFDKRFKQNGLK